jgi:uncharacterized protein YpmB
VVGNPDCHIRFYGRSHWNRKPYLVRRKKEKQMIAFIAGISIGTILGVFAMAFACMAKQSGEAADRMASEALKGVDLSLVE